MEKDSVSYIKELKKLPKYEYLKKELSTPFIASSSERETILYLFSRMKKCSKNWKSQKEKIMGSLKNLDFSVIEEKTKNQFDWIPPEIQASIKTKCNTHISVFMEFVNKQKQVRTFRIFFCLSSMLDSSKQIKMIKKVHDWFCFVNDYVDNGCSNTVDIFLYLISDKKQMPFENEAINKLHANTAFTTTCQPHTKVHIFRKEEWYRALIHESFHNLGLDFIRMGDPIIKQEENAIKQKIPVKIEDIRLYETYCEMWAEILNVMFFVWNKNSRKNANALVSEFQKYMMLERVFSLWQCVKVLDHNNIRYEELHMPNVALKYREKTNVFSYYVLKCILSVHLDKFLRFCSVQYLPSVNHTKTKKKRKMQNKTRSVTRNNFSLSFLKTPENLSKYRKLFTENYSSQKMINGTRYMEQFVGKKMGNSPFFKTLRMSLIESI